MRGFAIGLLLVSFGACAHTPRVDRAGAEQSLRAWDAALQQAVSARDLHAIVAFYADDAVLLPAAEPAVSGKSAIREEWHHILSIPDFASKSALTHLDIAASGDLGYTAGTYVATLRGEDGNIVTEPGKWVSVWKRQGDGTWRIVVDTYNTDIPPPDHK